MTNLSHFKAACFISFKSAMLLLAIFCISIPLNGQDSIQHRINQIIDDGHYPGIYFSVYDVTTGESSNYTGGFADMENDITMTSRHKLLSGSTGKTFVSAILMQLIGESKLQPDMPVSDFLGEEDWFTRLPNHEAVTVKNLMQHQSGLERYEFKPAFLEEVVKDADRVWQPEELIDFVLDDEPLFAAGEGFAYSDTNYILLGMIIEKITGKSYYENLEDRILQPLSLKDIVPTNTRTIDGLAQGYMAEEDPLGFTGKMLEHGKARYNMQFEWTGGGLAFRTSDYARWLGLLFNGKAFDMESLHDTFYQVVEAPEVGGKYGMGFQVFELPGLGESYGHSGFFPGYFTLGIYLPEKKLAIAMQVNTTEQEKVRNFFRDFLGLVGFVN